MKRLKIVKSSIMQSVESAEGGLVCYRRIAKWAAVVMILAGLVWQFCQICPGQRRSRSRAAPLKIIQLPEPKLTGSLSFEEVVAKQRIVSGSTAGLSNQPVKFEQMGQLAWAGQGITEPTLQSVSQPQRTIAAGQTAQQGCRLFFASPSGIYAYNPDGHSLEQTSDQDVRRALASAVANPEAVATAGCSLIIAGPTKNPAGRTAAVARRLSLLQAGQIAQNIQLQAASLNLASIPVSDFNSRNVIRICNLSRALEALYIIAIGYTAEPTSSSTAVQQSSSTAPSPQMALPKMAVLIASQQAFDDRELFETMRILNTHGVQTLIASSRLGVITGMTGGVAEAGALLSQLRIDSFDAVIFIGGDGAREYVNNPDALNIARVAAAKQKVLAAISTAPVILANAGVLRGVRATSFLSEQTVLEQAGAVYTGNHVERDGLIITANGPLAVVQFAGAIAEALAGK
jgi:protease I